MREYPTTAFQAAANDLRAIRDFGVRHGSRVVYRRRLPDGRTEMSTRPSGSDAAARRQRLADVEAELRAARRLAAALAVPAAVTKTITAPYWSPAYGPLLVPRPEAAASRRRRARLEELEHEVGVRR